MGRQAGRRKEETGAELEMGWGGGCVRGSPRPSQIHTFTFQSKATKGRSLELAWSLSDAESHSGRDQGRSK